MGCHCGEPEPYCTHHPQERKKARAFPKGEVPPYLPQPKDENNEGVLDSSKEAHEPGPWAFGRVTWNPNAKLVGIRPVVDRYSITRYGMKEWRRQNQEVLDLSFNTNRLKDNVKCTIDSIVSGSDKHQSENTKRLEERLKLVNACKEEMEQMIKDLRDEIVLLTEMKVKLKYALPSLKKPELIAGECIDRRTMRLEQDLIKDKAEVELMKELSMIREARDAFEDFIQEIDKQMQVNKACKNQLEATWSDKRETCELDSINMCLKNSNPIIGFYGGAVRMPENQSSPESWGIFNVTLMSSVKDELEKSKCLREVALNRLLGTMMQELRLQADVVYNALMERIEETDQCREMFERELQEVLRQITEAEDQYDKLLKLERHMQLSTKVVQTRLNNRLGRLRVENCRDEVQYGLMDEVNFLKESDKDLKKQLEDINKTVMELYRVRCNLEYFITTKRKSLYVDQQRCLAYRQKYPDTAALGNSNL